MANICLVCGCDQLIDPPYYGKDIGSDEICPSCGFQYGLDDYPLGREAFPIWREKWIRSGFVWFSEGRKAPENWDPIQQLKNIGVEI